MAENYLHFASIRLRVNGSGALRARFIGLDDATSFTMVPLTMASAPGKQPTRLSNFISQRARLELKTTEIDEIFKINRIIFYTKPLYSEMPG